MAAARQPLTSAKGLALVNSMIKDKELGQAVKKFKEDRHQINEDTNPCTLGPKYWANFLKRNSHRLESKRGHKFAKDWAEWSKYSWINKGMMRYTMFIYRLE